MRRVCVLWWEVGVPLSPQEAEEKSDGEECGTTKNQNIVHNPSTLRLK